MDWDDSHTNDPSVNPIDKNLGDTDQANAEANDIPRTCWSAGQGIGAEAVARICSSASGG